jgi:predicted nucleic acid-binding protein
MAEVVPAILVDSVIMIDHFNGIPAATAYLLEMQGKLAISVITRAEVLTGFEHKERQLARRLLDRFPILIIDRSIADLAATLRRQNRWKMPDALQAALAKHHKLKLATRDTDDFPPKRHRFVTVPYTI